MYIEVQECVVVNITSSEALANVRVTRWQYSKIVMPTPFLGLFLF